MALILTVPQLRACHMWKSSGPVSPVCLFYSLVSWVELNSKELNAQVHICVLENKKSKQAIYTRSTLLHLWSL